MSAADASCRPPNRTGSVTFAPGTPRAAPWWLEKGRHLMKARFEEARKRTVLLGAIVACGIATAAPPASAATFSARETHRGLLIDRADGTTGRLVSNSWFWRRGEPALVYREGGAAGGGVWETGPEAARGWSGAAQKEPVLGRIVPSWDDD